MDLFALSAEVWTGQLWRLWTAHAVHWSGAHFLLNLAALTPVFVATSGERRRLLHWMMISAPLISIALLLATPSITYRGASALILGGWIMAGDSLIRRGRSRGLGMTLIGLATLKLAFEITGVFPSTGDIESSLTAHCCGALLALMYCIRPAVSSHREARYEHSC